MTASSAQTAQDYFIGAEVGGYRITAKLGEGAMGVVYQGLHIVLGRQAAIKFLNTEFGEQSELISRFFTEAKAVNGIRHPNIVDITDFGQRGNRHYYVMELLEGQTLMDRLATEGRTDNEVTIRVAMQVAAALAAAHDKGVVHRDLKPENIFLCNHPDYPDYVKIFDFGIAKLMVQGPAETHRTRAGYLLGTPAYMSPEQCVGEEGLDHRSDIYSLGVVMYKMVTGVVPFDAPTLSEMILGHINTEPTPPRAHNEQISPSLEAVILRALAKKPEHRFQDMREFRAALQAAAENDCSNTDALSTHYGGEPSAAPPPDSDAPDKLIGELISIILDRIETDRLVLPSMPASALQAMRELDNPNVTFRALSKIMADDPVLAPQLFRKASGAGIGGAERPRTIEQAIGRLGMGQLRTTLIELSAHQVYDSRNRKIRTAFKGIWDHSIAVATAARLVAEALDNGADPEVAHLAGLMHDVGKPIVGALLLEAEKMLGMKKKDWLSEEHWTQVVDQIHRQVGTALAKKWQLPDAVIAAIAGTDSYLPGDENIYVNIVRFADAFANRCGKSCGAFDDALTDDVVAEGAEHLKLDWVFIHSEMREAIVNAGTGAEGASSTQAIER